MKHLLLVVTLLFGNTAVAETECVVLVGDFVRNAVGKGMILRHSGLIDPVTVATQMIGPDPTYTETFFLSEQPNQKDSFAEDVKIISSGECKFEQTQLYFIQASRVIPLQVENQPGSNEGSGS